MVLKTILLILVISILMEDSASIKKTAEEVKEDEEVARAVNATLAEEKKKEDEEKRRENEKKKKQQDQEKTKKEKDEIKDKKEEEKQDPEKEKGQDEACPTFNQTCPDQEPCPKVKECGPCPEVPGPQHNVSCRNTTVTRVVTVNQTCPVTPSCPEVSPSMTVPVALAVGAAASLLVTGVAAIIGLTLRYATPIESGFLFLTFVALTWYLSSHYPDAARELGARAATLLREAATALSHRVMEAIQRHNEQVGFLFQS
jgi:hypothetical protein